jgi:hypothetical protein
MMLMAATASPPPGSAWIGGPRFDLFFFFGSAALAVGAGMLMLLAPVAVVPVWLLWIWLIEGPHLFGTWQRSYLDAQYRREHSVLLAGSLLWLLPGPLLLWLSQRLGRPEPFLLFLGAAALWSFHHVVRQHHGLLSIYQRLGGSAAADRQLDRRLLHGVLWGAFVLFQLAHPANRVLWQLPPEPGPMGRLVIAALGLGLVVATAGWALSLWHRHRARRSLKAGLFALVVAVGTTLFSIFVVGLHEPLMARPASVEQVFLAVAAVGGILHGMHYIGIVIATSRRRAASGASASASARAGARDISARLGRAPLMAYLLMLALSLLYVGLNLLRGMPGGLPPDSSTAQWFLAFYWGLFLHHFWLDQKIWRPSADARLRVELGLAR